MTVDTNEVPHAGRFNPILYQKQHSMQHILDRSASLFIACMEHSVFSFTRLVNTNYDHMQFVNPVGFSVLLPAKWL